MNALENYKIWLDKADEDTKRELVAIEGNTAEIENRFFATLEFGTGGLRGKLGAGTYYVNKYTVGQATQGMAEYMIEKGFKSCVIGYDSRHMSTEFAEESAKIMAANGLTAYLFSTLIPTPVLSYSVRKLKADMGIMITASHNPKEYNGYKAYNSSGCQTANEEADEIYEKIKAVDLFAGVKLAPLKAEIITVPNNVYESYLQEVLKNRIKPVEKTKLKVLYTPLNGTGNVPIRDILRLTNIENVKVVENQEKPDGEFSTCPYPNPEFLEAYDEAFKLVKKYKPHIIIASDPDSDRIGAVVKNRKDGYVLLSGNEIGLLLLEYILKNSPRRDSEIVVKTIVTTALVYKIADKYNAKVVDTLTGFKYIGEQLNILESSNRLNEYVFGFEESNGYLVGTHARDKDAVSASMLLAEMAANALKDGLTLVDILEQIYADYGYIQNRTLNFAFEGAKGKAEMARKQNLLRKGAITSIGGHYVASYTDFLEEGTGLPKSDVIRFSLVNGEVIIRPSGTEPKIKIYLTAITDHPEKTSKMVGELEKGIKELLEI